MHKRGPHSVLEVVLTIPECSGFPPALAGALIDRVGTWFLPMYGCRSEADELCILAEDDLPGGHDQALITPVMLSVRGLRRPATVEAGWLARSRWQ